MRIAMKRRRKVIIQTPSSDQSNQSNSSMESNMNDELNLWDDDDFEWELFFDQ
jgi:hypothetical protein